MDTPEYPSGIAECSGKSISSYQEVKNFSQRLLPIIFALQSHWPELTARKAGKTGTCSDVPNKIGILLAKMKGILVMKLTISAKMSISENKRN